MDGQMNIFDFLKIENQDDVPEKEMVALVGNAIGVVFEKNDHLDHYEGYHSKLKLTIQYDNYNLMDKTDRFISCGWDNKKRYSAGGRPCDSIEEAIHYLREAIERNTQ